MIKIKETSMMSVTKITNPLMHKIEEEFKAIKGFKDQKMIEYCNL